MNSLLLLVIFSFFTIQTEAQYGYYGSPYYGYGRYGYGYGYYPSWVTGAVGGALLGGLLGAVAGKKK